MRPLQLANFRVCSIHLRSCFYGNFIQPMADSLSFFKKMKKQKLENNEESEKTASVDPDTVIGYVKGVKYIRELPDISHDMIRRIYFGRPTVDCVKSLRRHYKLEHKALEGIIDRGVKKLEIEAKLRGPEKGSPWGPVEGCTLSDEQIRLLVKERRQDIVKYHAELVKIAGGPAAVEEIFKLSFKIPLVDGEVEHSELSDTDQQVLNCKSVGRLKERIIKVPITFKEQVYMENQLSKQMQIAEEREAARNSPPWRKGKKYSGNTREYNGNERGQRSHRSQANYSNQRPSYNKGVY